MVFKSSYRTRSSFIQVMLMLTLSSFELTHQFTDAEASKLFQALDHGWLINMYTSHHQWKEGSIVKLGLNHAYNQGIKYLKSLKLTQPTTHCCPI
jgi:hypothetical protein